MSAEDGRALLEIRGLEKTFATGGLLRRSRGVRAVDGVSFRVSAGEAVALVGESGSGKSTIARLLLRLVEADRGEILLDGTDVRAREPGGASLAYRRSVQMVFQDPFGSLNPVHTVAHHLERPLLRHCRATRAQARDRALELLETVGLEPPLDFLGRRPYELSGGQRQRVAIARALAVEPSVLVADEPTSMLDVSIRAGVLSLLSRLKTERRLALVLITHDLAAARHLADRILVLHRGRIVEEAPSRDVVEAPLHPYTRELVGAIAGAERARERDAGHRGSRRVVPAAAAPSGSRAQGGRAALSGCPYVARCDDRLALCESADPVERARPGGGTIRCHLASIDQVREVS